MTCEGQTVTPDLDSRALAHIERRQSHAFRRSEHCLAGGAGRLSTAAGRQ
ncbi:DUF1481 domain-containing protein [Klebsiella pneumoniae subsp. pneumoniae]|nr:DUF1481 domain-containing protein [Klebsiella pneumoniae subsp. pneumoniae]